MAEQAALPKIVLDGSAISAIGLRQKLSSFEESKEQIVYCELPIAIRERNLPKVGLWLTDENGKRLLPQAMVIAPSQIEWSWPQQPDVQLKDGRYLFLITMNMIKRTDQDAAEEFERVIENLPDHKAKRVSVEDFRWVMKDISFHQSQTLRPLTDFQLPGGTAFDERYDRTSDMNFRIERNANYNRRNFEERIVRMNANHSNNEPVINNRTLITSLKM
jgi:hypothetical protein